VAYTALTPGPVTRASARIARKTSLLVVFAAGCLLAAYAIPTVAVTLGLLAAGGTLLVLTVLVRLVDWRHGRARVQAYETLSEFIAQDAALSFVTDCDGGVRFANAAAENRFGSAAHETLAAALGDVFANPGGVIYRLRTRAEDTGAAREDVVTRKGHVRLSVHRMGADGWLWRVEEFDERPDTGGGAGSRHLPMLTLGRNGTVLFMNDAARAIVGSRIKTASQLAVQGNLRPGMVNDIVTPEGSAPYLVAETEASAGRRELFLLPSKAEVEPHRAEPAIETLPVPLLKVAPDGAVLTSNREARELLGVACTENSNLPDLMEGLGRSIRDWLSVAASGRGGKSSEFLRLSRTDKEVFVQVILTRVTEDGVPVLIAVLNDATELKTLEAQFVQSQKMQAIGQLAGGVAHDFNNLLTAISGHCDLLLLRHDQGDPDYGDLVQINQNANRAAALVSQLLAFSRKQTLRPEVLDLRDTLSDLTHLLNRLVGEKVTLTLHHDPVLRTVRADKRQLEQVMMNLVVNARDAMPRGGDIVIETERLLLTQPLERDRAVVAPGEYVSVKVTDEGTGIQPDKLQKVFEPFYTTKRTGEGTGLGLSTVYGIIKQTGGFIFVDSVLGQGTSFTLLFPAHDEVQGVQQAPVALPVPQAPSHGDGVVLLVEDEAPVRAFASRALRLRGYTVLEAESAEDALRTLEDPALEVDVFVTDVVMPGMDGPSWVKKALETRPDVRVVFVSGYAEESFGEDRSQIPNSVFLPKPFSLSDLTETVHRQLN